MNEYLSLAKHAATVAGKQVAIAAESIDQLEIEQKSLNDYVSDVDRQSELTISALIAEHYPSHGILGEEYGATGNKHAEYQWVIDPLDGTTNFLRSIPHYAVSIALMRNDQILCGVIYDPIKQELFSAEKDAGAYVNDKPIKVSESQGIGGALLATGVPFSGKNLAQLDRFRDSMCGLLQGQTSGIRRLGSAALDLAYVAAGRYDGYWEAMLKPWDIAAGILLVEEAGGIVSDLCGGDRYLDSGDVLAANVNVHRDMLAVTSQFY